MTHIPTSALIRQSKDTDSTFDLTCVKEEMGRHKGGEVGCVTQNSVAKRCDSHDLTSNKNETRSYEAKLI